IDTLRSGRPFMTNDWLAEPNPPPARAGIPAYGMRAHLVLPLAKGGRVLGTLTVSHTAPREWTRYDLAIVEEAAERTWAAGERANVEEALKVREAQLAFLDEISQMMAVAAPEGEIMNRIAARIGAHLRLSFCSFADVDNARGELTASFGWQAEQPAQLIARTY